MQSNPPRDDAVQQLTYRRGERGAEGCQGRALADNPRSGLYQRPSERQDPRRYGMHLGRILPGGVWTSLTLNHAPRSVRTW